MEGPIDMERKGCESIGCWTHYVTLAFNLIHYIGLGFSRLNFHTAISTTMTSQWAWWRLKSPAPRLFAQPFIQAQIKEKSKLGVTGLCAENSPVTGEFPAQMASNVENASIWWRHHALRNGRVNSLRTKGMYVQHDIGPTMEPAIWGITSGLQRRPNTLTK